MRIPAILLLSGVVALPLAAQRGGGAPQPAPVSGIGANGKLGPIFKDGIAVRITEFADTTTWIKQRVWVEANFDSDFDGKPDRIHADVTRPAAAEKAGLKLPIIMQSSPYAGGTSSGTLWNVQRELGADEAQRPVRPPVTNFNENRGFLGGGLASEYIARGYAVVSSEQPGTGLSSGCPTVGDYFETEAPSLVIDWLNGRVKAFDAYEGGNEVKATSWTNGKVGMIGGSYLGTLPLSAAITGVKGLEALIPIAPNTSYYPYYRSNGLVRSPSGWLGEDVDFLYDYVHSGRVTKQCNDYWRDGLFAKYRDRKSGDFNAFWQLRDQLPYAKNIKAAVFFSHGTNDYNVVPEHTIRMWEALKDVNPKAKMYFHKGGHGGGPPKDIEMKWWAHYLYGVDNGIEKLPRVLIQADLPVNATALVQPPPPAGRRGAGGGTGNAADTAAGRGANGRGANGRGANGRGAAGAGNTATATTATTTPPPPPPPQAPERKNYSFADWPVPGSAPVTLHAGKGGNNIGTLHFSAVGKQGIETLTDDWNVAPGTMAQSASSPNRLLYALPVLKDSVHLSGTAYVTLRLAASKSAVNLSVYLVTLPFDATSLGTGMQMGIVTRGWADPKNWKSLTKPGDYHSMLPETQLTPGGFVNLTYALQPDDQSIAIGQQLAIMIFSSDLNYTLHPAPGTQMSIDLDASSFTLPIVGGAAKLRAATGMK